MNFKYVASNTEYFSGSDLRELCRAAAEVRIKEFIDLDKKRRLSSTAPKLEEEVGDIKLRAISQDDFLIALKKVRATILQHKRPASPTGKASPPTDMDIIEQIISHLIQVNEKGGKRGAFRPRDAGL